MQNNNTTSETNPSKTNPAAFVGVDISKDKLVCDLPEGQRVQPPEGKQGDAGRRG